MMNDDIDRIMEVMEAAFDPAFGEAWNRRQVSDALLMGNCRYLLAGSDGRKPIAGEEVAGFALSRKAADEEELLLLAVHPKFRNRGIATSLLKRLAEASQNDSVTKIFLEMREDNPAEQLYRTFGFSPIGRRPAYYSGKNGKKIDAITFCYPV